MPMYLVSEEDWEYITEGTCPSETGLFDNFDGDTCGYDDDKDCAACWKRANAMCAIDDDATILSPEQLDKLAILLNLSNQELDELITEVLVPEAVDPVVIITEAPKYNLIVDI